MKYLILPVLVLLSSTSIAQKKPANPKPYAASITVDDLKRHLYAISDASMEGRGTATEGERKAAAYIENHFKSLGLAPGHAGTYLQPFPVYRDSALIAKMTVNGKTLEQEKDFQPSATYATESSLYFSEVVYAGYGVVDSTYNSYGNVNVAGKAVLIMESGPAGLKEGNGRFSPTGTGAKVGHARNKGASALLIVSTDLPPSLFSRRMYATLFRGIQHPPTYMISEKTAELIVGSDWDAMRESLKTNLPEPMVFKAEVAVSLEKRIEKLSSANVLGVIEGTDKKDEYLVLTAHYDHLGKRGNDIYFGANDDGSGTVSVMEIAEAFMKAKAAGKGPRRSIIFMTVSGEENGLWGSAHYAAHPTVNPEKITANLNIDMIGRIDLDRKMPDSLSYVYIVGDDKISSESTPLNEGMNNKYTKLGLDYKFNDPKDPQRIYYRSDHYNFAKAGIPIIFYTDGAIRPDYHKPTDTPDKINYKLLTTRVQLIFYTAWEMANREALMKRDRPLPTETR